MTHDKFFLFEDDGDPKESQEKSFRRFFRLVGDQLEMKKVGGKRAEELEELEGDADNSLFIPVSTPVWFLIWFHEQTEDKQKELFSQLESGNARPLLLACHVPEGSPAAETLTKFAAISKEHNLGSFAWVPDIRKEHVPRDAWLSYVNTRLTESLRPEVEGLTILRAMIEEDVAPETCECLTFSNLEKVARRLLWDSAGRVN